MLFAATVTIAASLGQGSPATAAPQRGWAHSIGLINLKPAGQALELGSVVDRLAIQEVFARWGIAYDEGLMDVIASLFTADGIFQVEIGSSEPIVKAAGRDDILKTVSFAMKQQGDQRRHAISNIVIEDLTATHATVIAYGIVVTVGDQSSIGGTVVYSGNLVHGKDGVWRLEKLIIGMDSYAGTPPGKGEPQGKP
jgi:hypothetical protein